MERPWLRRSKRSNEHFRQKSQQSPCHERVWMKLSYPRWRCSFQLFWKRRHFEELKASVQIRSRVFTFLICQTSAFPCSQTNHGLRTRRLQPFCALGWHRGICAVLRGKGCPPAVINWNKASHKMRGFVSKIPSFRNKRGLRSFSANYLNNRNSLIADPCNTFFWSCCWICRSHLHHSESNSCETRTLSFRKKNSNSSLTLDHHSRFWLRQLRRWRRGRWPI